MLLFAFGNSLHYKLTMVFPARSAFIKVNLDPLCACAVACCAETKSKVVPKKKNARTAFRAYRLGIGTYPRNFDHVDIRSCGSDGCNTEVSLLAAVFGGGVRPLRRSNRRRRLVRSEWLQGWGWGGQYLDRDRMAHTPCRRGCG